MSVVSVANNSRCTKVPLSNMATINRIWESTWPSLESEPNSWNFDTGQRHLDEQSAAPVAYYTSIQLDLDYGLWHRQSPSQVRRGIHDRPWLKPKFSGLWLQVDPIDQAHIALHIRGHGTGPIPYGPLSRME